MDIRYILINLFLACVLFFANGYLGKLQYDMEWNLFSYGKFTFDGSEPHNFTGNFFLKIVNPSIYMSIIAVIGQKLGFEEIVASLWLLLPSFWMLRFAYTFLKNLFWFLNLKYEGMACIVSIILGESIFFAIIKPLLSLNESLWISSTELRDGLWFAIIVYVGNTVWNIIKKYFSDEELYPEELRMEIIRKRYTYFKKQYGDFIWKELLKRHIKNKSENDIKKIVCVLYAIMIFEDYNRSKAIRIIEYIFKFLQPQKTMTLGIMQVSSEKMISDKKSIQLALDRILDEFSNEKSNPEQNVILNYNADVEYYDEVSSIYSVLFEYCYDE